MLQTSKDLMFLAIAIAVLLFGGFTSFVLYQMGKFLQEGIKTVKMANRNLEKLDAVVDDVSLTVREVTNTVRTANEGIVNRVTSLNRFLKKIGGMLTMFQKNNME